MMVMAGWLILGMVTTIPLTKGIRAIFGLVEWERPGSAVKIGGPVALAAMTAGALSVAFIGAGLGGGGAAPVVSFNTAPAAPTVTHSAVADTMMNLAVSAPNDADNSGYAKLILQITTNADVAFATPVWADTLTADVYAYDDMLSYLNAGQSAPLTASTLYRYRAAQFDREGAYTWSPGTDASGDTVSTTGVPIPTVVMTGTALPTMTEAEVRTGSKTLIYTVSDDTLVLGGFDATRQATIDGLRSAQSEAQGFNLIVRDSAMVVGNVVRTSNSVMTVTLPAAATYAITANESVTIITPASVLTASADSIIAGPFSVIDAGVGGGSALFSDGFEGMSTGVVPTAATENGAFWRVCETGSESNVTVESDTARTGTNALRLAFHDVQGFRNSSWCLDMGQNVTEAWAEFYIYIPDGTESWGGAAYTHPSPGPSNNKFHRFYTDTWVQGPRLSTSAISNNLSTMYVESLLNEADMSWHPGNPIVANVIDAGDLGAWHRFRFHGKLATSGSALNGVASFWWDDALQGSTTTGDYFDSSKNYWNLSQLFGWWNSSPVSLTYIWIDDYKFYITDPGW